MIASDLKRIEDQAGMTPGLKKGFDFLRRPDIGNLPDGRVEIDGTRVFAIIQRYQTLETGEPTFEFHRNYIDIQFLASGQEIIGWAPVERMAVTDAYDPEKDIAFGSVPKNQWTPLLLHAGQAAVLRPEDAHAPKLAVGRPSAVMKIVVKVAV